MAEEYGATRMLPAVGSSYISNRYRPIVSNFLGIYLVPSTVVQWLQRLTTGSNVVVVAVT